MYENKITAKPNPCQDRELQVGEFAYVEFRLTLRDQPDCGERETETDELDEAGQSFGHRAVHDRENRREQRGDRRGDAHLPHGEAVIQDEQAKRAERAAQQGIDQTRRWMETLRDKTTQRRRESTTRKSPRRIPHGMRRPCGSKARPQNPLRPTKATRQCRK